MAIDNTTVVPKLIAARLIAKYSEARVFAQRTNRTWQSMLAQGGNVVQRNVINEGTITDYAIGTDLVYTDADVTALGDLELTKAKYWGVKMEDIRAIQSVSNVLDESVAKHGENLAEQVDTDVRAVMVAGATAGPAIALDHANMGAGAIVDRLTVEDFGFARFHRLLDLESMPRAGRWLIIGPYGAEAFMAMALTNEVLNAQVLASAQNGNIGRFGGFDVYVHGPTHSTLAVAEATETWMYGNDTAVAFIDQVRNVEQLRLESAFATAVRGLYTYGAKTDFTKRVQKSTATISNVPV